MGLPTASLCIRRSKVWWRRNRKGCFRDGGHRSVCPPLSGQFDFHDIQIFISSDRMTNARKTKIAASEVPYSGPPGPTG